MTNDRIRTAVNARNKLGEGVVWSAREKLVYWVDIESSELWTYNPQSRATTTLKLPEAVCSFAFRQDGSLLVGRASGLSFLDRRSGTEHWIRDLVAGVEGVRLNDGRCDRQGRFVVSSLDEKGQKRGEVYSTDGSLATKTILSGIGVGNSTCFSPDGKTMYFADTPQAVIWSFDYDPADGTPSNRRVFCDLHGEPGKPDGSTVDADGCLWNAQWGGSRIVRYDPLGRVDHVIELSCRFPTCIAFGGEGLSTLYVTSARRKDAKGQPGPADGALIEIESEYRGLEESTFCA